MNVEPYSVQRATSRVLMVHAEYVNTGGEESIFDSEAELLEKHGHCVIRHVAQNNELLQMSSVSAAIKTVWNQAEYRRIRALIQAAQPDIVHFHNTFPSVSPAGYYAAQAEGVPVVQSLHNFRTFCVNSFCHRDGKPCVDCLGHSVPWPGVLHSCHPRGRGVSASVAAMISTHRLIRTWHRKVNVFINAATQFSLKQLVAGGIPEERIVTKPNFIDPDPGLREGGGGYALFVGRLSVEKGIETLLNAWEHLPPEIPLRILGSGPLEDYVRQRTEGIEHVEYLGRRPLQDVVDTMGKAEALIFPSEWFEGMPRTIIESLAVGTPIIASDIGGLPEMVRDGSNGLLFPIADPEALAQNVLNYFSNGTDRMGFRQRARQEFEARYTAEENYKTLIGIYNRALQSQLSPEVAR